MEQGRRLMPARPLTDIRKRAQRLIAELPEPPRRPDAPPGYEVRTSARLEQKIGN